MSNCTLRPNVQQPAIAALSYFNHLNTTQINTDTNNSNGLKLASGVIELQAGSVQHIAL